MNELKPEGRDTSHILKRGELQANSGVCGVMYMACHCMSADIVEGKYDK